MKTIFIFIFKLIMYFISLFLWVRVFMPKLLSAPNDFLFGTGFILTAIFTLFWTYFLIKTFINFSKQINENENN